MNAGQVLRFGAVLVVLAGYVFVFRSGETRVTAILAENARTVERLRSAERALGLRPLREAERARLHAALRDVRTEAGRGVVVAHFLRDAAASGAAHRTTITTIAPAAVAPAPAQQRAGEAFDEIPLDLTVEGRYADVLATIRALSAAHVPASVDVASLVRKDAAGDATISAALHVWVQRFAPARGPDVPARPV